MLRKFSVTNYKNFRDEVILDLTAVRDYKFNMECINNNLLGKTLLMGPNGSGKSNLGYALFDIVYTLTDNPPNIVQTDQSSFINGNGNGDHARFCYEFQQGDTIINYEYTKTRPHQIRSECLSVNGEPIFNCNTAGKNNFKGLSLVNSDKLRIGKFDGSLSMLRYIANNTSQSDESPVSFVMEFVRKMLYFRSTQEGNMFMGFTRATDLIDQFIIKNGLIEDFEKFLRDNAGLEMKLGKVKVPGMPETFVQVLNKKKLTFNSVASSGTMALELYYYWSRQFDKVSLLFIDEFDAYYHFELAEKILRDVIKHVSTQTILTSHNTDLVSNDLMRADCYLQLKGGKIISFAESTDREIRVGHNLGKMLRNGEFE